MSEPKVIIGIIAIVVFGIIGAAFWADHMEAKAWQEFVNLHHCKVTEHKDGETSTGIGPVVGSSGGVAVITSVSDAQEKWECDNGQSYWKSEGLAKEPSK